MNIKDLKPGSYKVTGYAPIAPVQGSGTAVQPNAKLGEGAAGEFAGNALRAVTAPLVRTGGAVENVLDQTLGRGINAVKGNGFVPTTSGQQAFGMANQIENNADTTFAGKAGTATGVIAPYFSPLGAEELGANLVSHLGLDAAKFGPKVAAYLASKAPALTRDIGIGTAQTGNLKEGALQGIAGTVGAEALGKTAKIVGGAGKGAVDAIGETASRIASGARKTVLESISPKLTAKETADALASRGGEKTGILGKVKVKVDPAVSRVADTVEKHVPGFADAKTLTEKINLTKDSVGKLATDLKQRVIASGQDRIYSFKELGSTLRKLEKSPQLVGDVEKTYGKVVDKALDIARSNGGKISDLFQARKEFDQYIEKVFPDLYSSERLTPMRSAIKDIRNAMTDFTAEHLPQDIGLRDSLTSQSHLLQAIENMAEKAASGTEKEVGTTGLGRRINAISNSKTGKAAKLIGTGALGMGALENFLKD